MEFIKFDKQETTFRAKGRNKIVWNGEIGLGQEERDTEIDPLEDWEDEFEEEGGKRILLSFLFDDPAHEVMEHGAEIPEDVIRAVMMFRNKIIDDPDYVDGSVNIISTERIPGVTGNYITLWADQEPPWRSSR